MERVLLDTNVLMNRKIGGYVVLPVIRELDGLKTAEGAKGEQARSAIYDVYKKPETYTILELKGRNAIRKKESVDDYLLRIAKKFNYKFLTYDLSLFLKAKSQGIDAAFMGIDEIEQEKYNGIFYISHEEYSAICENRLTATYPLNSYIIMDDSAFKMTKNGLEEILYNKTKSVNLGTVTPRNVEQKCLMDALYSISPIVMAGGKAGSGKSYLMLSYALQELKAQRINKIVVVTNNSFTQDSREIGALPGGLLEKEFIHLGPLIDILGLDAITAMVEKEEIEVLPISIARGRSFNNAIIWASECQNLTASHMKLLISRIGTETRIFLDGDLKQSDSRKFARNSGIGLVTKLAFTSKSNMFSFVTLKKVERSQAAQLAEILDELD